MEKGGGGGRKFFCNGHTQRTKHLHIYRYYFYTGRWREEEEEYRVRRRWGTNGKEVFRICIISYRTHKVTLEHREGQFFCIFSLVCGRQFLFSIEDFIEFLWTMGMKQSLRESVLLRLVNCVVCCCCLEFCTIKVTCKKCFYSNTKVFFFF